MLTIRQDQLDNFAMQARQDFETRAVAHLRGCLSRLPEEASLRRTVQTGIARAAGYGIDDELSVLRYLNAMVLLGHDFDRNPKHAWAGAILRDGDFIGATKMAILKDLIARRMAERG